MTSEEPDCKYKQGSWSDWVHRYINATTEDELNALLAQIDIQWLQIWTQGLLDEFQRHFEPRLQEFAPDSQEWRLIVDWKWPKIGIILAQLGAFKWARLLYHLEYSVLCRIQSSKGRVHKGTPLHQIGWVELVEGTRESLLRSKYFMKLALIEDYLTAGSAYKNLPAFRVLKSEHHLAEPVLANLAEGTEKWLQSYDEQFDHTRPELIYLDIVRDSGNSEESDYFHFDPDIATHLLSRVENAGT
jgi:hypothetical protein